MHQGRWRGWHGTRVVAIRGIMMRLRGTVSMCCVAFAQSARLRCFERVTVCNSTVAAAVDSLFDPISGLFLASDTLELVSHATPARTRAPLPCKLTFVTMCPTCSAALTWQASTCQRLRTGRGLRVMGYVLWFAAWGPAWCMTNGIC